MTPPLTADEAGQLAMMQILLVADGRRRGGGAAVRVGRVRLARRDPPVLSRAAADPDRRHRLEPPGRPARRRCWPRPASACCSASISSSHSCSVSACRRWWLGYLSLLARPVGANGSGDGIEWYPVGRLVLWAAIIGTLVVAVADAQFRHRQGDLPDRTAQRVRARAARSDQDVAGCHGRADVRRVIDIAGGRGPAGRGGAADDPQHVQSLACRTDRESVRPAAPTLARPVGA